MTGALRTRLGYRGRALTLLGSVWLFIGLVVLSAPIRDPGHLILLETLPLELRVSLWWLAALAALVAAWWPTGADKWGFITLVIPAAVRALSYGYTTVVGYLTGNEVGDSGMWIQAIAWAVIVAFVVLLSAWPEPATPETGEGQA